MSRLSQSPHAGVSHFDQRTIVLPLAGRGEADHVIENAVEVHLADDFNQTGFSNHISGAVFRFHKSIGCQQNAISRLKHNLRGRVLRVRDQPDE